MKNQLIQWIYVIEGLIHEDVKLKEQIWLKEDELLLEKTDETLYAFLADDDSLDHEKKIKPYLQFTDLITYNIPILKGGNSGIHLKSRDKLGTVKFPKVKRNLSVKVKYPDQVITQIEEHAPKFLGFIRQLHDKYIDIVSENEFLEITLEYFYNAKRKTVYKNEGLINAVISLEALFNEGGSAIGYKVSHRSAFLLGLIGLDSVESFKKLKTFYNQRSKIVHGGGSESYDPDRYLLEDYTRQLIKIFLILLSNETRQKISHKKRKQKLLGEIDEAMIVEEKREVLKKEINEGIETFKLPVPRKFEGKRNGDNYKETVW